MAADGLKVRWLKKALQNLDSEFEYIAQEGPEAAERVCYQIEQPVVQLEQFPESGRRGRVRGTRKLIVNGTPYILPYKVRNNEVVILRVFHSSRKWPSMF